MISTRRTFLAAAGVLAAGPTAQAAGRAVRLGGPIFQKSDDPRELAREHRRLGYSAAYCPESKVEDTARNRQIVTAFAAENVVIAEAVGARCCVDIAGSLNPTSWYGPNAGNLSQEFFDATVENCRNTIDAVKPTRSKFTIEMMGWSVPDGPQSYLKLIKAVDPPAFGVHLDVCNGINSPTRFYRNTEFIAECFRPLGKWITSCHAKDLEWKVELNVHFVEVI